MGIEIERKFLIKKDQWEKARKPAPAFYKQGYLSTDPAKTIRVRVSGTTAFLTVKGISKGLSRKEFEYAIPLTDANDLLEDFSVTQISKRRYRINYQGKLWEVDEFMGENEGLILAEIELTHEAETFSLPPWIDKEVTEDARYYNSFLSLKPFRTWKSREH
jgi:adenylate cyclase